MNTFDDLFAELNNLLQTGNGGEKMKPDSLHGMEQMPTCPSHDFSGLNELLTEKMPHDFDLHPHSAFSDSTSHSFSFASGSDAAVGSCHHVTIDSLGYVHQDGETEVGKVDNFNMYSCSTIN